LEISPLIVALVIANPPASTAEAPQVQIEQGAPPVVAIQLPPDDVAHMAPEPDAAPIVQVSSDPAVEQGDIPNDLPEDGDSDVIVVTREAGTSNGDPMFEVNEQVFNATMAVDDALVEPIADSYRDDFPTPLRKALANFFRNLTEPVNFLNFLLQGKPLSAIKTMGRFAINSTLGIGGFVDVAKKDEFDLPYRENGFANTLGYYGVGPGPFMVLPLVGATTLRDFVGNGLDQLVLPTTVGKPFNTLYYAVPAYTVNSLEWRIEFDDEMEDVHGSALGYDLLKQYYLERRTREINDLKGIHTPTFDELMEQDRLTEEGAAAEAGTAEAQDGAVVDQPADVPAESAHPEVRG
jgi:phospholipid-binding lipoprotein MlaA